MEKEELPLSQVLGLGLNVQTATDYVNHAISNGVTTLEQLKLLSDQSTIGINEFLEYLNQDNIDKNTAIEMFNALHPAERATLIAIDNFVNKPEFKARNPNFKLF